MAIRLPLCHDKRVYAGYLITNYFSMPTNDIGDPVIRDFWECAFGCAIGLQFATVLEATLKWNHNYLKKCALKGSRGRDKVR